jgi:2-oxoglutarate dehydrogenase E2 component (dihydrolipoamide succinyltransferase)
MATEIKVPTLGESVSEATVAQWLKKKGEAVAADEPLVELETDKVTLEVNAPAAGVLSEIAVEEGANVEVGAVLGAIEEGASAAPAKEEKKAEAPKEEAAKAEAPKEEKKAAAPAASANGSGKTVEVPVPTLGESVSEATVASWLKKEGDSVSADEPLVELETDKVTLEVNAPAAGKLSSIKAKEGETVEVGAVLALIAGGASGAAAAPAPKEEAPAPKAEEAPKPATTSTPTDPSPGSGLDAGKLPREGGKVTKEALLRFFEETTPPSAMTLSPAVATLIAEKGLDPNRIKGTGPEGRITKEDVLDLIEGKSQPLSAPTAPAAQPAAPAAAKAPTPTDAPAGSAAADVERVKMPKLRQTIARRLKEAQNTAAMLTTFNEVDMGAVMEARAQYKEAFEKKHGVKLGFMSFFVKAVVASLQELPAVNGRIEGEEIVYNKRYHIGVAVSTPNGLMVPVLRDADKLSFAEIEAGIADLGKRARDGKLSLDEMQGGTFTITNGGIFGSLLSTPILNTPQSGILGMHKIQERPMAVGGEVKIRPMMYLAHSYDHRLIDGREAVTFLVKVKEALEDPQRLLLGV